jgi:hypothetical protein
LEGEEKPGEISETVNSGSDERKESSRRTRTRLMELNHRRILECEKDSELIWLRLCLRGICGGMNILSQELMGDD